MVVYSFLSRLRKNIQPWLRLTVTIKMLISSWYLYGHGAERSWKNFNIINHPLLTIKAPVDWGPQVWSVFVGRNSINLNKSYFQPASLSLSWLVSEFPSPIMAKMPMPGWGTGARPGPVWGSRPSPAIENLSVGSEIIIKSWLLLTNVQSCYSEVCHQNKIYFFLYIENFRK